METVEEIEYRNHTIKVYQDPECPSPNDDGDEGLFLVYDNPRNFSVKRKGFEVSDINDFLEAKYNYNEATSELRKANEQFRLLKAKSLKYYLQKGIIKEAKKIVLKAREAKREAFETLRDDVYHFDGYDIYPVYAYIHSGVALSLTRTGQFNCRWDSSSNGYVLLKRSEFDVDHFRKDPELAEKTDDELYFRYAEGLIEYWNDCLSDNVYGFEIVQNDENETFVDSCWRFVGDYKGYMLSECKSIIDNCIKRNPEKYALQLELELF